MNYLGTSNIVKNRRKNTIAFLSLLLLIVIFFLGFKESFQVVGMGIAFLIWIPIVVSCWNYLTQIERYFIKASFSLLFIIIAYYLIGYSKVELIGVTRNVSWIMSGVISVYALRLFSAKEQFILFKVFTVVLIAFLVMLISKGRDIEMDEAFDTANTWVSSMFMILSGICVIACFQVSSLFYRIVFAIILLLSVILNIFILQRGTNAVLLVVEILLISVLKIRNKFLVSVLFTGIVFFLVLVYFTDYYIDMFNWMAQSVPSERIAERIQQISLTLKYVDVDASGGTLSARSELMARSWNTFTSGLNHFLLGAGAHKGSNMIIGNHSFILDTLGSFGIVGGSLLFVYFKKFYQIIMSNIDQKAYSLLYPQSLVIFAVFIFRNYFGAMATACINFVMLIYFPLVLKVIQNSKFKVKS